MTKRVPKTIGSSLAGRSSRFKLALTVTGVFLALSLSQSARAATQYWDVNGASGTWSTSAADWSASSTGGGDVVWTNSNDAYFSSGADTQTGLTTIATTSLYANSATFDGQNTGAYTFTNAGTITLGNATTGNTVITMAANSGAVTFQGAIILAQPATAQTYTIANNSSNLLTFGSTFTESAAPGGTAAQNTVTLVFNGSGGVTFNGAINGNNTGNPGGNVFLSDTGAGALSFNATNNAEGVLAVSGSSTANIGSALALQDFNLQMIAGSTVNFTNGITAATIAGLGGTGGTLTLTNNAGQAVNLTLAGRRARQRQSTVRSKPNFCDQYRRLWAA